MASEKFDPPRAIGIRSLGCAGEPGVNSEILDPGAEPATNAPTGIRTFVPLRATAIWSFGSGGVPSGSSLIFLLLTALSKLGCRRSQAHSGS
jgi:hypothetical protein